MTRVEWRKCTGTLLVGMAATLAACGEDIVYRDRPAYDEPAAAAGGFLGLSSNDTRQTVCGNCHSGKQAQWHQTKHASAWTTLASSGQSKPECEGCHSVSAMGNAVTQTNVGWVSTKSERYQHVQCESCHGPGLNHVLNPDVPANKPLASLAVAPTATTGCGECHSGVHRPFAEEWSASRHAKPPGTRGTNASCVACHEAKGVLQAWGITSNFVELSTPSVGVSITCAVCHDPHNPKNPGQLRFPVDVPVLETNLCMKCHYRRSQPDVTSSQGPHSPQGPTLLGEAGWFPPNFAFPPKSLVGSHGTDRNPKLCATCHVSGYQITDAATGAFSFRATGHSFQAIPCVDAQGIPTSSTTCDIAQRSFRSCTNGCHATEGAARTALSVARLRIDRLVTEISGMLPQIPASEFSTTDNRISTGEGSKFNMQLAQQAGATPHNPYLVEALLLGSIRQIELDYGITPSVRLSLIPELAPR